MTSTDIVPTAAAGGQLVASSLTRDDLQLVCQTMAQSLQLALKPNLRRERDDFEMLADEEFNRRLIAVACYLDSLQFYRSGRDRYCVFTYSHVQRAFCKALSSLGGQEFVVDSWYFDMLPDEVKEAPDPDAQSIGGNIGRIDRDHSCDWVGELMRLETRWPGLVLAFHAALTQQTQTEEQMKAQFKYAMDYMRGQSKEPMANLGRDILKARRAPGGGASGSGLGGRVLGGGY